MSAVTDLIGNATSDSYTKPTQYNTWQPSGTNQLDNSFVGAVGNNVSNANAATPYWQQYLSQLTTNPYNTGAQTSANNAGTVYTNTGNQAVGNSNNLSAAGNQVLQTSMDPQSSLYKSQYQTMMDQTNANEAARGITNSGYGADLANEAGINFNSNWLNQQLGRETQGITSATGAFSGAGNLGTNGANSIAQGGAVPLSTYNAGVSNLGAGLTNYNSGVSNTGQTALADIMNYLGLGAQQSNQQGNFDQQYYDNMNTYTDNANQQNAAMWDSVGNLVSNGAASYGNGKGGGSGFNWSSFLQG
jgi:hypothetical protein